MKKLLLLFAVMLSAVGAWAQTTTKVKGEILSAETLMAKTEPVNIVIQNISTSNRWYFCGNKNLQTYETNSETWFVWEPSGDGATFYLKKLVPTAEQGEGYLQKTSPSAIGAKETAQTFKAEYKYPTDAPEGTADSDNLVRFVRSDNTETWINCQPTTGTPVYNNGAGAWTMHNVYAINDVVVEEESKVVSSLEDLSNDKVYTLKSGRSNETTSHYLLYHSEAPDNLSSTYGSGHAMEYNDATANFHFAIYKSGDKYYFYNIAAAKFIGNNDNNNGAIPLVDYPSNAVEIRSSSNSTYNFVLSTNGTGALNAAATSGCHGVVNWTGGYNNLTDGGNIYQITEVGGLDAETKAIIEERINAKVNIVYNYYDGETLVGTETLESVSGFPYPQPTSLPGYVSCQIPDGTVSEGGTFNVQCTLKSDFPFSTTDYFGLSLRGGAKWFAVEEKTQILTTTGLSLANLPDAEKYSWILEGTWHSGFYLKHKTGMYVAAPNATPGNGAEAVLVEEKSDFAKFQIVLNGGKYYVKLYGTDNNCITDYGGNDNAKMKFWNSGWNFGDSGSQFAAEPVDADAILQAFKAENATTAGYVGGYDASIEEVNALTIYSVAEFVANTQRVELEVGKPYRIQNVQRNRMIGYDGTNRVPTSVGKAEISTVWSFENGATEGTYYIKNLNANAYMKAPDGGNDLVESNMASYNVPSLGQAQFNLGVGSNLLVDYGGNKGLGVWWGNGLDSDGAWYIIPATELDIEVTSAGWATTCLPFDVVLPEELTAYALTDVSGVNGEETGSVSLISKAGIKANQGALLKGDAGTYTLSIEETSSNWDANLLSGTTVAKDMSAVEGDVYLLTSDGAGSAQLSKLKIDASATDAQKTLPANKAYLNITPSATRFLVFNFGDDNATAIEGIEAEDTADAVVYDLAGRRVQKAQKGLYIVNGKKVIK